VFIGLHELEVRAIHFDVDVPAGEIDFVQNITQSTTLHAQGSAELLNHSLGEVRIHGNLSVTLAGACDRCLEQTTYPVQRAFDLVYLPQAQASQGGEDEIDEAGIEVGFYSGAGLELNDVLREVVLLALPMQMTCSDECKGICPSCGQNRNLRDCGCQAEAVDDRWSKLRTFRVENGPAH